MKGMAKTAGYLATATLVGIFAYWFAREHGDLAHQVAGASRVRMFIYLGVCLLAALLLAALGAREFSTFLRSRAEKWILQSNITTGPIAEFEEAQRLRSAGRPLDAIGVLREYLQANPYELHTMARIAEIYRYDLKNDLAAALEYEELLKHQLPDDQWSWAALHLAKLYGRRNEMEKSLALLERLDAKYGHTVAGRRAKKALEQVRNPEAQGDAAEEEEPE